MGGGYTSDSKRGEFLMANYLVTDTELTSIADAIRAKGGTSSVLEYPAGFVSAVDALPQMTDDMSWMGADVELVDTFGEIATPLSDTLFASWTPSTTAKDILATQNLGTFVAADIANYEYYILWECTIPIVTNASATKKALPLFAVSSQVQSIYKRPSTWANIEAENFNSGVCSSLATGTFLRYYGTTTGTMTYTWATSYGFYFTLTAATFSSATAASPTITVKTPKVTARCSTTYMSTANAALIDQDETVISMGAKVYRAKTTSVFHGNYANVIRLIKGL